MRQTFLLIIIALFMTTAAKSQTLVDTNKLWSVVECSYSYGNPVCITYFNRFQGDTIFGLTHYNKFFIASDSSALHWGYVGAMRQDSNKKVYFHDGLNEYLLYDFGLSKNDTFNIHCVSVQLVVDSIDTVALLNGEKRRRLIFSSSEQWIDGVGSMFGPTNVGYYNCFADMSEDLNCFKENDTLKYDNIDFPSCYYVSGIGISELNSFKTFSVVPNPFTESTTLTFSNPNHEYYTLKIYDITGQLARKISHITGDKLIIEKGILKSGLYLFVLTSDSRFFGQGKLIIE